MKAGGTIICFLIIIMDIVAGILRIKAEIAQNKGEYLRVLIFECKAPVHQAYKLGLAAAVLLGLAHAVANLLGGCTCICSRKEFERIISRQDHLGCWIHTADGRSNVKFPVLRTSCGLPHHHFLAVGGILCFVHGLFCVACYVSSIAASLEEERRRRDHETHEVHVEFPWLPSSKFSSLCMNYTQIWGKNKHFFL